MKITKKYKKSANIKLKIRTKKWKNKYQNNKFNNKNVNNK